MRTWLLRHPNVAVVLLGVWFVWCCWLLGDMLDDRQWLWAVVAFVAAWSTLGHLKRWWGRT